MAHRLRLLAALLSLSSATLLAQHPRDAEIHDPDTLAWWHTTEALSNDAMEGRDTGSPAYQRAADYVRTRFQQAGLKPAGENGSYFQTVPMHEVAVTADGTSLTLLHGADGKTERPIGFLTEITLTPSARMPLEVEGPLTFRGYCGRDAMQDIAGKVVVCFGTQRTGLPGGAERAANARAGHAAAVLTLDDPYFTIEPPRWPAAYARSVTIRQAATAPEREGTLIPGLRLSDAVFPAILEGTGQDAAALLKAGGAKQPLPSFEIPGRFRMHLHLAERDISSPNILAVLPGTDMADQYLVVAAHLDGYGFGTPVAGDALYNGALDDAAYVALLIQLADDLRAQHLHPKRSILFCAFTGEEKGLLGSNYFVAHPTVPVAQLAADINLDQLRPLFPLKILTASAVDDTTLGATARQVGAAMGIEIRPDREPERGLLRRADNFPFLRIGVPAIGFIFGYDPGTDAEKRYREWYQVRYHRPQDDLTQPMDFTAAARFDQFFYKLTETVADAPERPHFLPGSPLAPKGQ